MTYRPPLHRAQHPSIVSSNIWLYLLLKIIRSLILITLFAVEWPAVASSTFASFSSSSSSRSINNYAPLPFSFGSNPSSNPSSGMPEWSSPQSSAPFNSEFKHLALSYFKDFRFFIFNTLILKLHYRVSLKKGSFRIPAPMEALGCSKGLDISQKHCQSSFFG